MSNPLWNRFAKANPDESSSFDEVTGWIDEQMEMQDATIAALREENQSLLDCLNGSSKAVYTAEMYDALRTRVEELERENKVLSLKCKGTLANNLCPDHRDKQAGKPCLACIIEKLDVNVERAETQLRKMIRKYDDEKARVEELEAKVEKVREWKNEHLDGYKNWYDVSVEAKSELEQILK